MDKERKNHTKNPPGKGGLTGNGDKDKKDIDKEFEQNTPHVHEDERALNPGGMQNDPCQSPETARSNPL